jgi:hypothetical protein
MKKYAKRYAIYEVILLLIVTLANLFEIYEMLFSESLLDNAHD